MFRISPFRLSVSSILMDGSVAVRLVAHQGKKTIGIQLTPMLHIAARAFYDDVLAELHAVTERTRLRGAQALFAKEGVAVTRVDRDTEINEIVTIAGDQTTAREVERLAQTDSLFNEATIAEICAGYGLKAEALLLGGPGPSAIVLQDAYFVPTLIARFAANVALTDVVLEEETAHASEIAKLSRGTPLQQVLERGFVKQVREEKCADGLLGRLDQLEHGSEVHVLWGHHHTDGLREALLRPTRRNTTSAPQWEVLPWRPSGHSNDTTQLPFFGAPPPPARSYGLSDAVKRQLVAFGAV